MRIFPTNNERTITLVVSTFVIGIILGLIAQIEETAMEVILTALTTLVAAFSGAYYAFRLQSKEKDSETISSNVAAGNKAIFSLLTNFNKFTNFRDQFINEFRENEFRYLYILPAVGMARPSEIDFDSLGFIFKHKNRNLLAQMSLNQSEAESAMEVITLRSSLHNESIQRKLDEVGLNQEAQFTLGALREAVGERDFAQIVQLTNQMISSVDSVIETSEKLIGELQKTIVDIYPKHIVIGMQKISNQIKKDAV
jgi:hypothetical protein